MISCAAVSRRDGRLLDAHLQIVPQADERRVGLDRPLGELELISQLLQLGIDRAAVPCSR